MIVSKIVVHKAIGFCVIDMEAVVDCRSCACCVIRDHSYFFAVCVDSATTDVTYQGFGVLEATRLTHLLDLVGNREDSDV